MAEKSNEQIVRTLIAAAFHEGTLEHRDSPSHATLQKARDAVEQAKAAVLARMCGPGEVVVPVVPTEAMINAGHAPKGMSWDERGANPHTIEDKGAAMLAARPNNGGNDDASK